MKRWGFLLTLYYVITVVAMLWPLYFLVAAYFIPYPPSNSTMSWERYVRSLHDWYAIPFLAVPVALVFIGQVLLFLNIDRSVRRLKPRASLFWPAALSGLFTAVLGCCLVLSVWFAAAGENPTFNVFDSAWFAIAFFAGWAALWVGWAILFYIRMRHADNAVARATSWLLKGSILEFLVVVPCHVIVRRREDCCAPAVTGLGMCVGFAIMLISFGPSVLFLYRKQMESYKARAQSAGA